MATKKEILTARNKARAEKMRDVQLTNYNIDNQTGCWLYGGCIGQDGYGKMKRYGRTVRAHRVYYEQHVGPIEPNNVIMHSCDNPPCVNPKHLTSGTHLENELDKDKKKRRSPPPSISHPHRMPRKESHPKSKLNNQSVSHIRESTKSSKSLAKKYSVWPSTIERVRCNKTWA